MILVIDNYDSFTYNLVQYVGEEHSDIQVFRNDKITVEQAAAMRPDGIILSPGPGYPDSAGICIDLIKALGSSIPILGVCLGHQAVGYAYGGKIVPAPRLMHGKADQVRLDLRCPLFDGLQEREEVGRYHSLVIDPQTLPPDLEVRAASEDKCIMAVQHKSHPVFGIQFHPESVLTPHGKRIIHNFIHLSTQLRKENH